MHGVAHRERVYVAHENINDLAYVNYRHNNHTATIEWEKGGGTEVVPREAIVTLADYAIKYFGAVTHPEKNLEPDTHDASVDADASPPRKKKASTRAGK